MDKLGEFLSEIKSFEKSLYITYGENDYGNVTKSIPRLEKILRDKKVENLRWKIEVVENEGHVPYIDSYNGLIFTFDSKGEEVN